MFDFEKLEVYKKARTFNKNMYTLLNNTSFDRRTEDQLRRASYSIMLNIAEGSGRFTNPDMRKFYIIARGSAFECLSICDLLRSTGQIEEELFISFYNQLEEISKMLFGMIRGLK